MLRAKFLKDLGLSHQVAKQIVLYYTSKIRSISNLAQGAPCVSPEVYLKASKEIPRASHACSNVCELSLYTQLTNADGAEIKVLTEELEELNCLADDLDDDVTMYLLRRFGTLSEIVSHAELRSGESFWNYNYRTLTKAYIEIHYCNDLAGEPGIAVIVRELDTIYPAKGVHALSQKHLQRVILHFVNECRTSQSVKFIGFERIRNSNVVLTRGNSLVETLVAFGAIKSNLLSIAQPSSAYSRELLGIRLNDTYFSADSA